ncbi:MAG: chitobiase/beta-hexosaminidase C-terminal domain-containing protein, partial [Spirochaetales bacterium]|nr:chitobiase/beta-hexosaminidase C-terminal domain-containing protein [Spirochaetales bacterium]
SQAYVYEGKTVNLTVKAKYSDDTEKDVTSSAFYTSNDSTILTVDESGVITGVAKGTCSIKITYTEDGVTKEKSVNFEVLAEGDPTPVKTLKSIALSRDNLILAVGGNASLNVTAYYDDGSSIDVTSKAQYTSEKIDISSVDGNGVITGISGGTTTILVSYEEDGVKLSGTCAVTVKSLSSIAFDKTAKTIAVGSHSEIILTATYSDGSTKAIANDAIFESDNNSFVSISDGMFEAKAAGTAKIKASYTDSGVTKTAEIAITVTMDKVVSSLALSVDGTKVTYTLKATASYSDGSTVDVTDKTIYTIVTGSDIAALSSNVLTASKNGTVTISATYKDGGESVSCQKEVNVQTDNVVLSDIALNLSETSIEVGKTASVTVNASYSDGTTKDVTSEAKVEISGTAATLSGTIVTGASAGKATVTATYDGKTASASITVKQAINGYRVHFYGASWSTYKIYYYNSSEEVVSVWDSMPSMKSEADGHFYDLTESWVAAGKTMVIFYGGDNNNRYPADQMDGVTLPTGVNEAWFNFATKEFETANPFSTDPTVGLSPSGNVQFSGAKQSVKLTAANCSSAKYTTDGSDPKTSGTAYTDGQTISVGESLSIGQSVTVKVWGTDGSLESTASATFTKVDKPATPTRLGAYYTSSATAFSIWSPDSSNVTVTVTPKGGTAKEYTCTAGFKVDGDYPDSSNIYGVSVSGDLHLAEYQFKINGKAVRDPYGVMVKYENDDAKTNIIKQSYPESNCTVTSYAGSSVNIVIDLERISPTSGSWASRPALENRAKSVVYEIHVGDFTSHSSWGGSAANAGKFAGMVETGTKYSGVSTGIDHLKELGVTHVQILPFYDFATKYNETIGEYYNWGYDPVNYNVPEERYSLTPSDYENRIREVKDMVDILHQNGIRVIMDVVYNHTFDGEMFKNISNKYYTTKDLSGCGNSVDVTNSMVSRMVRDSLEYWLETYNLDGFRFDLMGIFSNSAIGE